MESADLIGLMNFEAVWQRVQNEKADTKIESAKQLERLIELTYERMCGSKRLAQLTCGGERKRLMQLSECLKKRYVRWQLLCFLMTGEVHFASCDANFASYTPYNLRKLWQSTVENAELIEKCNFPENMNFLAELDRSREELACERKLLEDLITRLLW